VSGDRDAFVDSQVREMRGAEALPRANGELIFDAPWEGRAFGTALAAVDGLGLDWDVFRQRLIASIAADPERPYYESWVAALEALTVDLGLLAPDDIDARAAAIVE
jgi:hypothetical protein